MEFIFIAKFFKDIVTEFVEGSPRYSKKLFYSKNVFNSYESLVSFFVSKFYLYRTFYFYEENRFDYLSKVSVLHKADKKILKNILSNNDFQDLPLNNYFDIDSFFIFVKDGNSISFISKDNFEKSVEKEIERRYSNRYLRCSKNNLRSYSFIYRETPVPYTKKIKGGSGYHHTFNYKQRVMNNKSSKYSVNSFKYEGCHKSWKDYKNKKQWQRHLDNHRDSIKTLHDNSLEEELLILEEIS